MNLFLASTFSASVEQFKEECPIKKGNVMFIANPGDPFKGRKPWIEKDRKAFIKMGYTVVETDLRKLTPELMFRQLWDMKIVHICGGSAVYILDLLKKKSLFAILRDAIENNSVYYTGTSAGSMIMAPDISFAADDEDEQEAGMVGKITDFSGFGFAPFYFMCHAQEEYYVPSTKKAMERLPKNKLPILFLNDGQAVVVKNKLFKIV